MSTGDPGTDLTSGDLNRLMSSCPIWSAEEYHRLGGYAGGGRKHLTGAMIWIYHVNRLWRAPSAGSEAGTLTGHSRRPRRPSGLAGTGSQPGWFGKDECETGVTLPESAARLRPSRWPAMAMRHPSLWSAMDCRPRLPSGGNDR